MQRNEINSLTLNLIIFKFLFLLKIVFFSFFLSFQFLKEIFLSSFFSLFFCFFFGVRWVRSFFLIKIHKIMSPVYYKIRSEKFENGFLPYEQDYNTENFIVATLLLTYYYNIIFHFLSHPLIFFMYSLFYFFSRFLHSVPHFLLLFCLCCCFPFFYFFFVYKLDTTSLFN